MGNIEMWGEMGGGKGGAKGGGGGMGENGTASMNVIHVGPYNTFSIMELGPCH